MLGFARSSAGVHAQSKAQAAAQDDLKVGGAKVERRQHRRTRTRTDIVFDGSQNQNGNGVMQALTDALALDEPKVQGVRHKNRLKRWFSTSKESKERKAAEAETEAPASPFLSLPEGKRLRKRAHRRSKSELIDVREVTAYLTETWDRAKLWDAPVDEVPPLPPTPPLPAKTGLPPPLPPMCEDSDYARPSRKSCPPMPTPPPIVLRRPRSETTFSL